MEIAFAICSLAAAILVGCAMYGDVLTKLYGETYIGERYWPALIVVMLSSFVVGCILGVA